MNILCCFKAVPDPDRVLSRDWESGSLLSADLSYAGRVLGCYDEAALEAALRLKDSAVSQGVDVSLTAVTVSGVRDEYYFRWIFAAGADRVCVIPHPDNGAFAPEAVSSLIASAFAETQFDAVFCGIQSADGGSGLTPFLLAKKLSIPCLSNVTAAGMDSGCILVKRQRPGGSLTVRVGAPVVLAVGDGDHPDLRLPTVKKRMAAADKDVETLSPSIPLPREKAELRRVLPRSGRVGCVFAEGESCEEKVEALLRLHPEVRGL